MFNQSLEVNLVAHSDGPFSPKTIPSVFNNKPVRRESQQSLVESKNKDIINTNMLSVKTRNMRNAKRSSTVLDYAEIENSKLKDESSLLIQENCSSFEKVLFENSLKQSNTEDGSETIVSLCLLF